MTEDLKSRLREVTGGKLSYTNTPNSLLLAAADRIEALTAERDALKEGQIDAIRAALEAAAKCCVDTAKEALDDSYLTAWLSGLAYEIRALDPAAIAAKLKGESDDRA